MKCPNCSAECSDQALECDFCGHPLVAGAETVAPPAPPVMSASPVPPAPMASSAPPSNPYQGSASMSSNQSNQSVPDYFVWSIIATVIATIVTMLTCCCIPLGLPSGIAAIVFANKVKSFLAAGDISSAEDASKKAKLWTWVTTIMAIVFGILMITSFVLQAMGIVDQDYLEDLRKQMEANR
jgi:hypothetical protein